MSSVFLQTMWSFFSFENMPNITDQVDEAIFFSNTQQVLKVDIGFSISPKKSKFGQYVNLEELAQFGLNKLGASSR